MAWRPDGSGHDAASSHHRRGPPPIREPAHCQTLAHLGRSAPSSHVGQPLLVSFGPPGHIAEALCGTETVFRRTSRDAIRKVLGSEVATPRAAEWRRSRAVVQPSIRPRHVSCTGARFRQMEPLMVLVTIARRW